MLEGVGEAGELGRRVRLGAEEGAEVQRAHAQRGVLELGRFGVVLLQAGADEVLLATGLLEVVDERGGEVGLAGDARPLLEQLDGLGLDRVGVGEVLDHLLADVVG